MFARIRILFGKHRLVGNIVVYSTLMSSADFACQRIQHGTKQQDWGRTARMGACGAIFYGPVFHFVYRAMDKAIPGTAIRTIIKKCAVDQLIITPISCVIFYVVMSALERRSINQTVDVIKEKWLPTYQATWMIWPAAQAFNFAVIPSAYRVVYMSSVAFVWNILLSYIKNTSQKRIDTDKEA